MPELPKREPYERQFLKLMAKGMKIIIEERIAREENEREEEKSNQDDGKITDRLCS